MGLDPLDDPGKSVTSDLENLSLPPPTVRVSIVSKTDREGLRVYCRQRETGVMEERVRDGSNCHTQTRLEPHVFT